MKNIKTILASAVLLVLAISANAQTLTRSLVLKPAGETNTLTLTSTGGITTGYTIFFPGGGEAAAAGPFMKVTTASGNKTVSFGQVNLASNAAAGDVTGTLGVTNGGTGLTAIAANQMLVGSGPNTFTTVSAGSDGQILGNVGGVPTWGYNVGTADNTTVNINGGDNTTTNINTGGTGGDVNIGNATSTTTIYGDLDLSNANVDLSLPTNNIFVGVGNLATPYAPGTAGQVLTIVGSTPTWASSIGNGGSSFTVSGSTLNLNITGGNTNIATSGTGTTTIGNDAGPSTTNINGDVIFGGTNPVVFNTMPNLPLTENYLYVGNASNYAAAFTTPAGSNVLTTVAGVPTWADKLGIADGGTNSTAAPTAGAVAYGNGTEYAFTAVGTAGQILKSNGAAAPSWTSVNDLLSNAAFTYTVTAANETDGYATINTTTVPTLISAYGYTTTAKIIITYESVSGGPAQVAMVGNRDTIVPANGFRIYSSAMSENDLIHIVIIP